MALAIMIMGAILINSMYPGITLAGGETALFVFGIIWAFLFDLAIIIKSVK